MNVMPGNIATLLGMAALFLAVACSSPAATPLPQPSATATAMIASTPTATSQPTATPNLDSTVEARTAGTIAAMPTATPAPTSTPQPTATPTPVPAPTATPTPVPTATPTPTLVPTSTPTPRPTLPPTATPQPTPTPTPTATPTPVPTATATPTPTSTSDRMDEIDCSEPCVLDTVPFIGHVDWVQKPQISVSGELSLIAQIHDGHNLILPDGASEWVSNINLSDDKANHDGIDVYYGSVVPPSQPEWNWVPIPGQWIADTYTYQERTLTVIAQIDPAAAIHPGLKVCLWSGGAVSEAYISGCEYIEQP